MAGDDSRMGGGESRMTGDCCRPEGSIHRCVRTHSHLYSYIYGLVALLDNIQSSVSSITISTGDLENPRRMAINELRSEYQKIYQHIVPFCGFGGPAGSHYGEILTEPCIDDILRS